MLNKIFLSLAILLTFATNFSEADTIKRGLVLDEANTEADLAVLKSWNANIGRFSLAWGDQEAMDSSTEETYNAWLEGALTKFDVILDALEKNGIKVILNLHTPPGGFSRRDSKATHRLFQQLWTQEVYLKAWEKIATRYKGRPGIWAYDLLNEPAQPSKPAKPLLEWNALAQEAVNRIRAIDSTTTLIMSPVYGQLSRINQMKALTGSNISYTIHYYDYWNFVHQGIYGVKLGLKYPTKKYNKTAFQKRLLQLNKFQKKNKTRILIGEFSVARWASNGMGAKYLGDLCSLFERYKFDWTYHSFRGADIWDLEVPDTKSITTRSTTPTKRLLTIQKFLAKNAPAS